MYSLEEYYNLKPSFKENYLKNNEEISGKETSTQLLYSSVCEDTDIVLNYIGMSPKRYGYRYWKDAIFLSIDKGQDYVSVCHDIYPYIAKKNNKTVNSVERAMRECLQNSWLDDENVEQNLIYDHLKNFLVVPRNSEIIVKISELISSKEFQNNKSKL